MSSELVLRWGIASTGLISQDFCTAVKSLKSDLHVLQAVGARSAESAKAFADRFNIQSFYGSYDQLFKDDAVNIIYVGSINTTHKEICLKAIEHGKHVLCEKPMTLNAKEQEEVLTAAKKKGVFFMEALWTRFFPIINAMKDELAKKSIGEVKFFSGNFMVPIKNVDRVNNKDLGGSALLDIGIYPVQLACLVFNHEKPIKITATGHLNKHGVDEALTLVLLYSNERIAQINISTNCFMFGYSSIVGETGLIEIPSYSWSPTELRISKPPSPSEVVKKEWMPASNYQTSIKIPLPECEKTNFDNSVGLRFQAEASREAISKGLLEHPFVTHDNSRLIMSILDEARKQLGCVLATD